MAVARPMLTRRQTRRTRYPRATDERSTPSFFSRKKSSLALQVTASVVLVLRDFQAESFFPLSGNLCSSSRKTSSSPPSTARSTTSSASSANATYVCNHGQTYQESSPHLFTTRTARAHRFHTAGPRCPLQRIVSEMPSRFPFTLCLADDPTLCQNGVSDSLGCGLQ